MASNFAPDTNLESYYWRLTLRNQTLTTLLFIPFIGYFFLLVGGLTPAQMLDISLCLLYAGAQDAVFHSVLRRLRLMPILKGIANASTQDELRRLKIRLLNYPAKEAWLAPVRWYLGMSTLYLLFATRHEVGTAFLLNLFLLPTFGNLIAWYTSFMVAEATLAPIQETEILRSIPVAPEEYRQFTFTARFMAATLALALVMIHFFLYLLLEPVANREFLAHPWLHSAGSSVVMLGFAGYAAFLTRAAFRPALQETTKAIEEITDGKLSVYVPQFGPHDLSGIGYLINRQATRLAEVVGRVRQEAESQAEAADTLGEQAEKLANESAQQLSAIEQVSQQVNQIEGAVGAASKSIRATVLAVEQGSQAMAEVTDTMAEIDARSREIGETVTLIDAIIRQVNMLALNATIEAARAGTQGRGFAVVADEISKLSAQTKENSRRIREALQNATEKTHAGNAVVSRAKEQFESISRYSSNNAEEIARIAEATGEAFTRNVGHISGGARAFTQLSHQVVRLAEDFRARAASLEQAVRYFD